MIPRIVYAAWCGPEPLPTKDCFFDSWRKILPGYDIHLLGDKDIPETPCTKAALERGKIVTAAQYACWKRLYETGGIYLDLDMDILRSLDDLLTLDAFLGIEFDRPAHIWAACGIIGAKPGHPFIRECLDYMDGFDHTHPKVENELGPRMFTKLLADKGWKRKNADATVAGVTLLNSKRFYPYSWEETFTPECVTPETYAVHRWAYTWKPKTSVVIPCHNDAKYLPEAIESVLAQTEPALEIIVVDDGSTDDTAKVAKRYPVTLLRQKNKGVSAARNAGIKRAKGPGIVCLDADDRLHPEFIKTLAGLDDIASCDLRAFGERTVKWAPPMQAPKLAHITERNMLLSGSWFRRQFWEQVGGYDETMRDGYEDWDFWVRCMAAGASAWVKHDELMEYRTYPKTATRHRNSFANADHAALTAKMRAKWRTLGITKPLPPLHYPVRISVPITVNGTVYPAGSRVEHDVALAAKRTGQLMDPRIA